MSQRHRSLTSDQLDAAQKELYDNILNGPRGAGKQLFPLAAQDGSLNGPFGVMLHAPVLGNALQNLGAAIRYKSSLSDRVREISILRVAVIQGSDFEWFAHERVGRAAGLTDEELLGIRTGNFKSADESEQVGFEIVDALLVRGDVSDEEFHRTAGLIGVQQIYELVVLVGYYRTLAQSMRVFGVDVPQTDN
ncbi:carboxymuconolactone decarboxylase family protein [Arthrobacter sp. MI7-26]|uniref:carboxymuconolactone decarboxylase family protein n=1 Tax=Arthrobacter sp. MI7-26 TaxID=2993653 RepID=UPI002248FF82|nr:carboxymuconolactone decarboxylase family protein [Arthrobacter sp. MI7-26]MCX2746818.1 carboxymuconolactone decarboxylase family protein [Arthrobacter sp. MI7-26]